MTNAARLVCIGNYFKEIEKMGYGRDQTKNKEIVKMIENADPRAKRAVCYRRKIINSYLRNLYNEHGTN